MRLLAALILAVAASLAPAHANDAARVDRFTDLVVEMMPIGEIFETLAGLDPNWPMQHNPSLVDKGELACLRDELSRQGHRRSKRREVVRYLADDPARAAADLAILERGAAKAFGLLVREGAEAERKGTAPDEAAILAQLSETEAQAMLSVISEPEFASLRRLAGIGNAMDATKTAEENEAAGREVGADLATRMIYKAVDDCGIDPARLGQ